MQTVSVLFNQIVLMYLLMFLGMYLFKTNKISLEGSKSIGQILLHVVIPVVVIKAFISELTQERLIGLGMAFVVSLVCLIVAMVISHFCFKKQPIESFGASFSNAGFIGIPLVSMLYGDEAVFYVSSFVALLNILQWTYGVFIMTKDTKVISLNKIMTNPVLISLIVGIVLYLTQIQLPTIIISLFTQVSNLNAPLAMFSLGVYLGTIPLSSVFKDKEAYFVSLVRLIVIPLVTMVILIVVPSNYNIIRNAILIVASTPIGSNVAIFAQLYNQDYGKAVRDVCLSTLLCVFTLPIILYISSFVF